MLAQGKGQEYSLHSGAQTESVRGTAAIMSLLTDIYHKQFSVSALFVSSAAFLVGDQLIKHG